MARLHRSITGFLVALAAIALAAPLASADEVEFDNHVVYYNAINTTFLSPEVARAYDVRRSVNRAMVNITVMERTEDGLQAVSAEVSGNAQNQYQQMRNLRFREIRDGDAVYHLAEVSVRGRDTLVFELEIRPEGSDETLPLAFTREFFVE